MNILITGAGGQLCGELLHTANNERTIKAISKADLDICDAGLVLSVVDDIQPDVIVNTAAYTNVDKAEEESGLAMAVNADGVENVARAADRTGARLVHLSTDFIFGGSDNTPYYIDSAPAPNNMYASSKLEGEQRLKSIPGLHYLVIRTAWLYSLHGRNFVTTMLRLMEANNEIKVVCDQIGTPTWARGLAKAIWCAIDRDLSGVLHWTDAGVASWYDFAVAISEEALALKLIDHDLDIKPVQSKDFPQIARRPAYSVLDKHESWSRLKMHAPHWRFNLRTMLSQMEL